MHAVMLGVTWGLLGLDVGWRPLTGGGVEYTIQIAPHEMDIFKQNGIEGDVPPQLRDIRVYRVVVGNDVLLRQDPPKQPPTTSKLSSPTAGPDVAASSSAQRKSSAYNPFSSLSSLVSRYPFGQSDSDPAKRPVEKEASGPKATSSDRWFGEKQPKVEHATTKETTKETKETSKETPKPWLPFTVVVLALFGSLGGNLYMGWIMWETRARYHALVRRRKKGEHSLRETTYEPDAEAEDE